ncbi:hypothetical protein [Streptomyces virginiae]|uniref:hypothetical protein n=1 Tax=Streptomyces virginiae TaxID=1961 RepID=UPI0036812948
MAAANAARGAYEVVIVPLGAEFAYVVHVGVAYPARGRVSLLVRHVGEADQVGQPGDVRAEGFCVDEGEVPVGAAADVFRLEVQVAERYAAGSVGVCDELEESAPVVGMGIQSGDGASRSVLVCQRAVVSSISGRQAWAGQMGVPSKETIERAHQRVDEAIRAEGAFRVPPRRNPRLPNSARIEQHP